MVLWLSLVLLLLLWSCWRIVVLESLDGVWYRLDGTVSGFWVPSVVKSGVEWSGVVVVGCGWLWLVVAGCGWL